MKRSGFLGAVMAALGMGRKSSDAVTTTAGGAIGPAVPWGFRRSARKSKYEPHQGTAERLRRQRQLRLGQLSFRQTATDRRAP